MSAVEQSDAGRQVDIAYALLHQAADSDGMHTGTRCHLVAAMVQLDAVKRLLAISRG